MQNNDSSPSKFSVAKEILSAKINAFIPILGIFLFVFTFAIVKNFYDTNRQATRFGEQAITQLEHHINQTSDELNQLSKNISKHCQREDIIGSEELCISLENGQRSGHVQRSRDYFLHQQ